jgi:hypothetical protein
MLLPFKAMLLLERAGGRKSGGPPAPKVAVIPATAINAARKVFIGGVLCCLAAIHP